MNKVHKPLYFYLMLFFSTTIIGALLLYLPFTGKKPIRDFTLFYLIKNVSVELCLLRKCIIQLNSIIFNLYINHNISTIIRIYLLFLYK